MLVHMILNAYWQPLDFELPRLDSAGENPWRRWTILKELKMFGAILLPLALRFQA